MVGLNWMGLEGSWTWCEWSEVGLSGSDDCFKQEIIYFSIVIINNICENDLNIIHKYYYICVILM